MVVRKGTRSRAPVWDPLSGTNSAVAHPLPCRDASLQAGNIRLQIVPLGGDPGVIVVGAKVAVAWIARKGDNRALLPMSCHLGRDLQSAVEVRARGATIAPTDQAGQHPHCRKRSTVGHPDHAVDYS